MKPNENNFYNFQYTYIILLQQIPTNLHLSLLGPTTFNSNELFTLSLSLSRFALSLSSGIEGGRGGNPEKKGTRAPRDRARGQRRI